MKRNIIVSVFSGFFGSALLLILLSATGIVGARDANVSRSDISHINAAAAAPLTSAFTHQGQLKQGNSPVNSPSASTLGSSFTYQGYLKLNGSPISATCQMTFTLYDDPVTGNVVGFPINNRPVAVNTGYFTQLLDMGGLAFTGDAAWLEINVNCNNNVATLARQLITATPYALSLMPGATISPSTGLDGFMLEVDNNYGAGTGRAARFESDGRQSTVAVNNAQSGEGLYGDSRTGDGLHGKALSFDHAGIVADNSYITGTALSIHQGGIQVQGAGLNSNTAVFTHRVLSSTIIPGLAFESVITNPLTDNQPNAILIITSVWNPAGSPGVYTPASVAGVLYNAPHWRIWYLDTTAMVSGTFFNVMVVNP